MQRWNLEVAVWMLRVTYDKGFPLLSGHDSSIVFRKRLAQKSEIGVGFAIMVPIHSVRHWAFETEELRREVAGVADERLKNRRSCMGNESRLLTGESTILPMGFMHQQTHETMVRLRSSISGSADVRSREGIFAYKLRLRATSRKSGP